jgi:basic membrane protein A and related proteins
VTGKRLLLRVVTLLAIAALVAAAGASARTYGAAGPASKQAEQATTFKIGLVTDIGGLNDRSFNHLAYLGLQRAKKKLKVQTRVLTSSSGSDYVPNLATLAQQKYNLVIGVGFLMNDAINTVATRFPNVKFAIIDFSQAALKDKPKNVRGLLFKEQEAGYLVGYLAALMEKRRAGADVISSVGGQKIPPVDHYIAGYKAGARKADKGIKVLNGYSQSFTDLGACKELALNQIAAGSHVVFQVAGGCGLGALDAAKEKRVWGIGVDADQAYLGSHILTSALKKVDVAVYTSIQQVVKGKFKGGGDTVFSVKSGGIGIGKISSRVPKALVAKVKKIQKQIASGKIKNIPTTV